MNSRVCNKFTIFLPVKNGGHHLPLCVESILKQSYQDFELVILENQSTDGTAEWLQVLEKNNSKVKVIPSASFLSIEENWKRILALPKSEFMTIIGHDDLLDSDFLEVISNIITEQPHASLYSTHFRLINAEGKNVRFCLPIPAVETAAEFLASRMSEIRDSFGTGHVTRSKLYETVGGIPSFNQLMYADDALWLKLIGTQFKATSSQFCFSYRLHSGSVSGKPNRDALFQSLQQYLKFLRGLMGTSNTIARVVEIYAPNYVFIRCNSYYLYLASTFGLRGGEGKVKLNEIECLLEEFKCRSLDKSNANLRKTLYRKAAEWISTRCR